MEKMKQVVGRLHEVWLRNKDTIYLFIVILLFIMVVIGVYFYYFKVVFHERISDNTSDWGAFGGYFSGMVSVISIALLFYTLKEQRRANYRSSFENSYNRLMESYLSNIKVERDSLGNVFENVCLNAKQVETAVNKGSMPKETFQTIWKKIRKKHKRNPKYLDAYCGFLHIVHRIAFDSNLDFPTKKLYLHDFEHSLPIPVLMSILIRLCSKYDEKEKQAIELFKKYDMLRDLQIENATIDDAKNLLLGYEKKKKPNFLLMLIENAKHINLNF